MKDKKFLGVILGICLMTITGCFANSENDSNLTFEKDMQEKASNINFSIYNDSKIQVTKEACLYNESKECIGKVLEGNYLDISSNDSEYLNLANTNFYIKYEDVKKSDRWFKNQNHLLAFDEQIVTKDIYSLKDLKGNVIINFIEPATYTVYVKPAEDDLRYGVLFQNSIYYIDASDVIDVKEVEKEKKDVATSIPVLMYHFFYDEEKDETRKDGNYVEVKELDDQLNYLVSNSYTCLTMQEVYYFMNNRGIVPYHSLAITIDDGDPSVYKYAYPVFQKYKLNATLFLICGWEEPTMSYDFWQMREDGLELQSHGFLTHQGGCSGMGHGGRLLCMDHDEGVQDTRMSLDYVDGGFVYCYPFGDVNSSAKEILKDAGVKMAFTTANGWISPGMDLLELPRVRVTGGNSLNSYIGLIQ